MTISEKLIQALADKIEALNNTLNTRNDLSRPQRRAIMEQIAENRERRAKAIKESEGAK